MGRRLFTTCISGVAIVLLAATIPSSPRSVGALQHVAAEITPLALTALEQANGCFGTTVEAAEGLKPARTIADAFPTFLGVAVDPDNGRVVMTDSGTKGLMMYDRAAGTAPGIDKVTKPLADLRGNKTDIGFVAGVVLDAARKEQYAVNNDGGDEVVVFNYGTAGDAAPKRALKVTHQAWGIALDRARDEMAVTVEINNWIEFYAREATGNAKPKRLIKGDKTGLADPHGIVIDPDHDEIVVANHGNWTSLTSFDTAEAPQAAQPSTVGSASAAQGGQFRLPSIRVFAANAKGDAAPIRVIEGTKTGLNWPMSLDVDRQNNEIAVANSGDNRVLIFGRTDRGNAAPIRAIGGSNTGLNGPMGVAIDAKNDEIWVTNYSDHSALVFARTANGNVAPKRAVRNAPTGTPSVGFGNPGAVAYDSKRDEILVPN